MPSSISNFDQKKWAVTWLLTAIMVLLTLGSYEWFLKSRQFNPSVEVTKDLWSWNRSKVNNKLDVIVLIGASRIQLGLNTSTMRKMIAEFEVIPLAINGHYPMATLKALAEDEQFKGKILMSFMAQMLEPQYMEMQQAYNDYYVNRSSFYLSLDAYLTARIKSAFRFMHPLLGLKEVVKQLSKNKQFSKPFYINGLIDTSAYGNYELVELEPLRKHFIESKKQNYQEYQAMDRDVWLNQLTQLKSYIDLIKSRGGDVALIRFPTDDEHWELDEAYYPRKNYWDEMTRLYPGLTTIHFQDFATLKQYELPDTSHLDQSDTPLFTAEIVNILQQQSFLPQATQ